MKYFSIIDIMEDAKIKLVRWDCSSIRLVITFFDRTGNDEMHSLVTIENQYLQCMIPLILKHLPSGFDSIRTIVWRENLDLM